MAQIPVDKNLMSPMGDIDFAVAIGALRGFTGFRKFGMNPSVASGTEDVWGEGGVLVWPTTAGQVSVVSTSTADDGSPAGTGAHEVTIQGLDADYEEIQETVTLNGTTPVLTTASFLRANRMFIGEVGSSDTNVGIIRASIGGNVQESILAEQGQSAVTHFTVPAGKSFIINYYSVGVGRMAGSSDANIKGQIRLYDPTVANASNHQGWRTISNLYLFNGQEHVNNRSVTFLPERTDIRVRITTSVATQAHGIIGGFLVDNEIGI
jgi:hypothetical protein